MRMIEPFTRGSNRTSGASAAISGPMASTNARAGASHALS